MSAARGAVKVPPENFFPIAVVGIGCRMPGDVNSPDDFWRVIRDGKDVVEEILPERWNLELFHHPDHTQQAKHCMRRIGMIKDIDKFDNGFFKVSPREALTLDPQQRHLLEVTHEAFEDAGILSDELGTDGGVFVGIGLFDYSLYATDPYLMDPYVLTGNAHSCAANRISFAFDIQGPSYACDTACASGLTALHLAATSLWNRECSTAVVGACNAILVPEVAIGFSQLGVISAESKSCPFSKTAKGYVRSEGWGTMILKPLDKAIEDNDHIYCTLQGTAIAANGNHNSLTMPSDTAQQYTMEQAYQVFGIDRSVVSYIEAHGTGTPVGDPIEARAIGLTFSPYRDSPLKIGSVKSNFGHQECCSGLASAIKVALMLDKKMLCPTINYEGINPEIDPQQLNLEVQQSLEPFPPNSNFTIGVNSFGFAGALAHMIFTEASEKVCDTKTQSTHHKAGWKFGSSMKGEYLLVPLSAKSSDALSDLASKWLEFEHKNDALSVVSWLSTKRRHFECKLAVLANSSEMFRDRLQSYVEMGSGEGIFTGSNYSSEETKICFVFPGQGQQWANMGRRLYHTEDVFRKVVDKCDALFRQLSGWSVLADKEVFNGTHSDSAIVEERSDDIVNEMEVGQPAILFFQIGLYELLHHWGIEPNACVGHSLGEIAAAYACGGLSLEEAVAVIFHRSQKQKMLKGTGSMAAVRLPLEEAKALCSKYGNLCVAAINAPSNTTIAGSVSSIKKVCQENPSMAKELRVQCAFHSSYMDPMENVFRKAMAGVVTTKERSTEIPFYSTTFAEKYDGIFSTDYWWANIHGHVHFQEAIERILDEVQPGIILELGASNTLVSSINQIANASNSGKVTTVTCGQRKQDDRIAIFKALATLYISGIKINWKNVTRNSAEWLRLPTYPWQRNSFWIEEERKKNIRLGLKDYTFKNENGCISLEEFPFLADHVVQDKVIFPGAGFIEYILEMCKPVEKPIILKKVQFIKVLAWPEKSKMFADKTRVQLSLQKDGVVVDVMGDKLKVCAAEIDDITPQQKSRLVLPVEDILKTCTVHISEAEVYKSFAEVGLNYGPAFQILESIELGDREAVGYLKPVQDSTWCLDIATLDGCFQLLLASLGKSTSMYLPTEIESLQMLVPTLPTGLSLIAHAKITDCDSRSLVGDITLIGAEGIVLVRILGCRCTNVSGTQSDVDLDSCLYVTEWQPSASWLPATYLLDHIFQDAYLRNHFPDDMHAVDLAEESLSLLRRAAVSFVRHALKEVPQEERHINDRYVSRLQVIASSNEESLPLDNIPGCFDEISRLAPESAIECDMLKTLGENLPNCLRNPLSSLKLLFSFLEEYFESSSSINIYYSTIIDLLTKAIQELRKKKQVVRILEVGARTGGFARLLLEHLKDLGLSKHLQYSFTDISQTFFPGAKTNLADFQFVKYACLDFQDDPESQGFVPNSVDILISLDALHSVKDLNVGTRNLRRLLCDGGWLLVMETTKGNYCQDVIFGCLELSWTFEDFRTESCWMGQQQWVTLLRKNGFDSVVGCSTPNEYFHSIMLGRKSSSSFSKELMASVAAEPIQYHHVVLVSDKRHSALNQDLERYLGPPEYDLPLSEEIDYLSALQKLKNPTDVVYIWSPVDEQAHCLLRVLQAVTQLSENISRLWVVTEGASIECHNTSAQLAVGIVKAASNQVTVPVISVDLDPKIWPQERAVHLVALLLDPETPETEIAIRSGETKVPRIIPLEPLENDGSRDRNGKYWSLESSSGSTVNEIGFVYHPDIHIGSDEVLVKVKAAAMNFKDTLMSLGMLDGLMISDDGPQFGLECSGTVCSIGSEVTTWKVGDEVVGFGKNCFASYTVCKEELLARKPKDLTWTDAAGTSIVFVTAYYCLVHKARLQEGEKVLIHSACGGLGLAAVQVAKMIGAEIIATAGTDEKRNYLQEHVGVDYVTDSRSDKFYTDIMEWTEGKGVDVVVNSLAGKLLSKSFALLKSEGRFCEVGKRDILQNSTLQMGPLLNNISFISCQIDVLMQSNPLLVGALLGDVTALIDSKRLTPCHTEVYDITSFSDVFKLMSKGVHIGKIVFEVKQDLEIPPHLIIPSSRVFKGTATYLISGGYGGIGQAMARWLCTAGARHIALVSRKGASSASSKSTLKYLSQHGVNVYQFQCDVSDHVQTSKMLAELRQKAPPLQGIFHLAGTIADESLETLSARDLDTIVNSKAVSAKNLHSLTLSDDLDIFFLLSSVTATWGHASQPGYVAANAYLDALAVYRHQHGLPALSLQLGPIRGTGFLERNPETAQIFASKGNRSLHVEEFLNTMKRLITTGYDKPVLCLAYQDWGTTIQFCHRNSMKFRHLAETSQQTSNRDMSKATNMSADDIESALKTKLAELLFVAADSIDMQQPMINYGVDSLMAVELVTWLARTLGVNVSQLDILSGITSAELLKRADDA